MEPRKDVTDRCARACFREPPLQGLQTWSKHLQIVTSHLEFHSSVLRCARERVGKDILFVELLLKLEHLGYSEATADGTLVSALASNLKHHRRQYYGTSQPTKEGRK